ncbi:endoglucanase-6B [Thelonectria olida]|uniref:Glucanase n=1 Tax=Thelonectria olida TaxID=1576542 RepID=A0A9P8WG93_9HYPO|nr:endoglucanase-6B [Thelonectria olida]
MDTPSSEARAVASSNPWAGKKLSVNPLWVQKLESTYAGFRQNGDTANAAKVRTLQRTGMFVWISSVRNLPDVDRVINHARTQQRTTGVRQIVGLVVYDIPGRDWNGVFSSGEFPPTEEGYLAYKRTFMKPIAEKLKAAHDLTFTVIVEPDAIGNLVTNIDKPFRQKVAHWYERGVAHAIVALQFPNVHIYVDIANGGWLGWPANLQPTADILAKIMARAKKGNNNKPTPIRGFSTNVSNFNPFNARVREPYTKGNDSWDESHYINTISIYLKKAGLPLHFIVDQGRVMFPGARKTWGEFANVRPAAFGAKPGTVVNNPYVDCVVWVKPAGESDGPPNGGPPAGQWYPEYIRMMVRNSKL